MKNISATVIGGVRDGEIITQSDAIIGNVIVYGERSETVKRGAKGSKTFKMTRYKLMCWRQPLGRGRVSDVYFYVDITIPKLKAEKKIHDHILKSGRLI